jgi:hypothetical protein
MPVASSGILQPRRSVPMIIIKIKHFVGKIQVRIVFLLSFPKDNPLKKILPKRVMRRIVTAEKVNEWKFCS